MRLILDGNSLLNAALLRGVDHDEGTTVSFEGKEVQVNSAQYGIDNFFDKFVEAIRHFGVAPRQVICTWDGRNAKARRQAFLPGYKKGRDKAPEVNVQLNMARERITGMLRDLGCHNAMQDGMEADDVIGYLVMHLRTSRNVVVTSDGDLSVLVDNNTDVWRLGELNKNPYGPFPHKFITVYKALAGDSGDKIPGAKGFGDGKFVDLVRTFGVEGLEAMQELIENDQLDRLREDLDALPCLKFILADKGGVATSWRVARLHTEDVNTVARPLSLMAGFVRQWDELDRDNRVDDLKEFYGTKTLVHAANYEQVKVRFARAVSDSPFVAMDIETSTGDQSDEWIAKLAAISDDKARAKEKVDVLGSELTGMGLTFGANMQHTIYQTVDHVEADGVKNITVDQCRELCELIPHKKIHTVIQNRAFEFPVLYQQWGNLWKGNGWHGMWPNAIDTLQGASYTNENLPLGLKERSLHHLGYQQQTYDEVTRIEGPIGSLKGGRVIKTFPHCTEPARWTSEGNEQDLTWEQAEALKEQGAHVNEIPAKFEQREIRQYKMNELTAQHVFGYGADDPLCTAALHTHYQLVMEMENTWDVYLKVEQKPEYLTSLAFVRGVPVSLETLTGMEKRDDERYEAAWKTLREFLMKSGWAGTSCPQFEEITPAAVKEAAAIIIDGGEAFTTKKRKPEAVAFDLRQQFPDDQYAQVLAQLVEGGAVGLFNDLVKQRFTGEPKINFASPVQMQNLFYRVIGITPRVLNKLTDNQRADPDMKVAFKKWRQIKDGRKVEVTDKDRDCWISKASTDDTAVDIALKRDEQLTEEQKEVLKAYKAIKTVMTRRSLFYKTYRAIPHWKDGRIHPSLNQSRAVTRRYSASNPNVQQLPKRGEGVEFRKIILPHKKNAVVCSLDFAGQELRLMAELSGDAALTSCYVGDNLRHPHVLLAVQAAPLMWGEEASYERIQEMRKLPKDDPLYTKAKTLYEDSKTTNFATQYDAMAERVSQELLCDEETAQKFIDAKAVAFPDIMPWKDSIRDKISATGFASTMMGARRHLAEVLNSDNKWEAAKAGRQGPNFEIQGSAGEMSKLAMARVWDSGVFADDRFDAWFYFPVHDELVYSVAGEDAVPVTKAVHSCMVEPYAGMKIPVVSSISLGPNYGYQIECGEEFDAATITAAVAEALGVAA